MWPPWHPVCESAGMASTSKHPYTIVRGGKLLDIAMAMVLRPRILLLDEPTSGVSAEEKFALMDVVFEAIRGERVTLLFVEHDIEIVRRYARRVLAFYDGRIIADGSPATVLNDGKVRELVVGDARPASRRGGRRTPEEGQAPRRASIPAGRHRPDQEPHPIRAPCRR